MDADMILLLDSEKNILSSYKTALEAEGYKIDVAMNEHDALTKFEHESFSVIITELYLKGASTFSLIEKIYRDKPETCIIVLTATLLSPTLYEKILKSGAQDCLTKPFPVDKILLHIEKGLQRRNIMIKMAELEKKLDVFETSLSNDETSVYDKRYFIKLFRQEQKRAERYKHPFSVIVMHINSPDTNEKRIQTKSVDEIFYSLSSAIRHTDYATRYNNSYSIILPETNKIGTQHLTKRLEILMSSLAPDSSSACRQPIYTIKFASATYPDEAEKLTGIISTIEDIH